MPPLERYSSNTYVQKVIWRKIAWICAGILHFSYFSIFSNGCHETGHFLRMLNDASLASLGLLMWEVLGCILCKNPLWVLSCKVNPLRCQTSWQFWARSYFYTRPGRKSTELSGVSRIRVFDALIVAVFNTVIRPIVMYASATWAPRKAG